MQPNEVAQTIKRLQLFNAKAQELESYCFFETARNQDGIHIQYHSKEKIIEGVVGVDKKTTAATCLVLRFFLNKAENVKLSQIVELYKTLPVTDEIKYWVSENFKNLNRFLDKDTGSRSNGKPLSYRAVLNIFVNGDLAHAHEKMRPVFEQWKASQPFPTVHESLFEYIVCEMISHIRWLAAVNVDTIKALEETIPTA